MKNFTFIPSCLHAIQVMQEIGWAPLRIQNAEINLALQKKETPALYMERISREKVLQNWQDHENMLCNHRAVFVGRRLVSIPKNEEEIYNLLKLYSGRNHVVYNSLFLKRGDGSVSQKKTFCRIKVKCLSDAEIQEFINSKQWQGEIGGYSFQGLFQKFIVKVTGSSTGARGLPCYEANNLLKSINF